MGRGTNVAVAAALLGAAAPASAGPWCSENDNGWAPATTSAIPKHAHLVFHSGVLYYAKQRSRGTDDDAVPTIDDVPLRATIDGTPVKLATRHSETDVFMFREVDVLSDKTGTPVITFDDQAFANEAATYTIDPELSEPARVALVAVTPYAHRVVAMRADDDKPARGAAIELDAPATDVSGRWRRDGKDAWRTFRVTAHPASAVGHTIVNVGETSCAGAIVPLELLHHGIELELAVRLADGKTVAVDGLARPFVLPPDLPVRE